MIPCLGILQGRLTPTPDGSIQFFPKDNWEREFVIAKQLGFDCIEWLIKKESCEENPLLGPNGPVEILRLASFSGVAVPSIHGFYSKSDSYTRILEKIILAASVINAKTILISFFKQNTLNGDEEKNLARRQLKGALSLCEQNGIWLGIETEMPAPELLEFVRSFNHPNVGVYYDIGNMASMGVNVGEEIRLLGDKICGVHVKDRLANGGKTVPLGEGCADFEAALAALRDVGYKGPFIIQGARIAGVDDVELNKRYYRFCKNLLERTYKGGER